MIWKKNSSFREGITEGVRNSWSCGIHGQEAEINADILAYFLSPILFSWDLSTQKTAAHI